MEEGLEAAYAGKADGAWGFAQLRSALEALREAQHHAYSENYGLRGRGLHKATREVSEEAEKASFWLWLRRWAKT